MQRLVSRFRTVLQFRAIMRRFSGLGHEVAQLRDALPVLTEYSFAPPGSAVLRAQADVTEAAPRTEYAALYRSEEVLYWLHLPQWILEWAETAPPRTIVDIGAGFGTLSVFCAQATDAAIVSVDMHPDDFDGGLASRHGIEVHGGNVELMELPWKDVDAVVMTEVIEHFNFHPVPTMRRIAEALRDDGRLFLSTPDADSWGRVEGEGSYADYRDMPDPDPSQPIVDRHVYQFDEAELRQVLEDSGFRVVRLERAPGRWGFHFNVEAARSG